MPASPFSFRRRGAAEHPDDERILHANLERRRGNVMHPRATVPARREAARAARADHPR